MASLKCPKLSMNKEKGAGFLGLYNLTSHDLRDKIVGKEITVKEVLDSFYQRIESVEGKVKAYITVAEREIRKKTGENLQGKLAGIPLAIKDNISTDGIKTTCASRMLKDYVPPYNATIINKLNKEGAVIIGKTNLDEFAMGSSTENSAFFSTHNPWNLEYVPGGSSGGSAAAVAAGEAAGALGSDTGGSIRQPASYCGVVGLKPTYGRVSRFGLVAFASSLDQIGIFTRDVEDAALLMNVITGHDPLDSTSTKIKNPDYTVFLKDDISGMRIGLPVEYFSMDMDYDVRESVVAAVKKMEDAGAEIEEVDLPSSKYALAVYYVIASAEASTNLARYDGVRYGYRNNKAENVIEMYRKTRNEGFGDEVKRRIMLGVYVLSSGNYDNYYLKAQKARNLIKYELNNIFKRYDLIILPTTPTTAFKLNSSNGPFEKEQMGIFTVLANIAGIPAISIPCGFDSKNLPIGIQVMGPHFSEGKLLQAAYSLEKILEISSNRFFGGCTK